MVYVERGEPGYPQPQFHPPPGYLADFVPDADMNHQLYETFFDRALKNMYIIPIQNTQEPVFLCIWLITHSFTMKIF